VYIVFFTDSRRQRRGGGGAGESIWKYQILVQYIIWGKGQIRERIPCFLTVVSFATTPTEFLNNYFGLDVDVAKKKDQSGTAIIADERRTEKN